jgi:DNA replication and repair protein RecF
LRLTRLRIRHFRNLGVQDLELPPEGVALVGDNAQGKSNLLEAIYYLETFRSFRGARDDQLLAFGADVFRVEAGVEGEDDGLPSTVAAAFQKKGRRKKVTVDGAEPDRIADALGRLGAVVFSPADVAVVNEGPGERRRFLDIVLSLAEPGYLEALQRFRQVLSQRNASLKDDRPGAVVRAWDGVLVKAGARIMAARARWVEARSAAFTRYYETVSGGRPAAVRYRPNVRLDGDPSEDGAAGAYERALAESAETERRTRTTMVGPQRDEMVVSLEGEEQTLDVRDYGSGGQRRTAALALRLVEADTIRDRGRGRPLVLLDDVFAELDAARSERVLELLDRDETGQVILTAPKESDVRLRSASLRRWRIEGGRIRT